MTHSNYYTYKIKILAGFLGMILLILNTACQKQAVLFLIRKFLPGHLPAEILRQPP